MNTNMYMSLNENDKLYNWIPLRTYIVCIYKTYMYYSEISVGRKPA